MTKKSRESEYELTPKQKQLFEDQDHRLLLPGDYSGFIVKVDPVGTAYYPKEVIVTFQLADQIGGFFCRRLYRVSLHHASALGKLVRELDMDADTVNLGDLVGRSVDVYMDGLDYYGKQIEAHGLREGILMVGKDDHGYGYCGDFSPRDED